MPRHNALLKRLVSSLAALTIASVLTAAVAAEIPRSWSTDAAGESGLRKPAETIDSLPGSNNIVDIIFVAPDVWAATAKGPSRLTMPGDQWTTYDETDGLPSIEIPALEIGRAHV